MAIRDIYVSVIDTATNTVIDTIPRFNGPTGIKNRDNLHEKSGL